MPINPCPKSAGKARSGMLLMLAAALAGTLAAPATAQQRDAATLVESQAGPAYAELVTLARQADMVLVAEISEQAEVKPERAPGLAPGKARLYLKAETETLLFGRSAIGTSLAFLADRDLDAKGKAPKLKDQRFLLFARTVAGRPGEMQLVSPRAMLPAAPDLVERTRTVLRQVAEGGPQPEITGIREVISIAGNLAGESETQMFLATTGGEPVSLTVLRRPGMVPEWGVSWSDIVDPAARAPEAETLEWYRLACSLPAELPDEAFLQDEANARARAREDYAFVLEELGACDRGTD